MQVRVTEIKHQNTPSSLMGYRMIRIGVDKTDPNRLPKFFITFVH